MKNLKSQKTTSSNYKILSIIPEPLLCYSQNIYIGPSTKNSPSRKGGVANQKYYGSIFSIINKVQKELEESK